MPDNLWILIFGLTLFALAFVIAWPRKGLIARIREIKSHSLRIRNEDALKHLYDCEYRAVDCTLESIAGALGISADDAARLVERLESLNLILRQGANLRLTSEGRSYALRIIRVHRLWERYLSDETGVKEADWHAEAERQEHLLTPKQTEHLAQRLGNPVFDPHGDPIPTATGTIPDRQGIPLTSLSVGATAGIIHIEDEPQAVYAQLVALGLYPGMSVRLLEYTPERLLLEVQGNEIPLAPVVAANVTVVPLTTLGAVERPFRTLAELRPGERGIVMGISSACRGLQRRRLMDLGVVPGTPVEAELSSATGDPVAYRIRGATVALRKQQAEFIFMKAMTKGQ